MTGFIMLDQNLLRVTREGSKMADIEKAIREAHKLADKLIDEAQDVRAWHKKPFTISNGQAVLVAVVTLLAIIVF